MTIHVWKHWFWITGRISLLQLFLTVALLAAGNYSANAVTITGLEPATLPDQLSHRHARDDVDDTINGANSDLSFVYPIKKVYTKYTDLKKYKSYPKTEERMRIKIAENEKNETNITHVLLTSTMLPNTTVMLSTSNDNETTIVTDQSENEYTTVNFTSEEPFDVSTEIELPITSPPEAFNRKMSVEEHHFASSDLDAGAITGIALTIVVVSGLLGAISFVLYRRRYLNKPQVLNDKSSNLDSSGYIDDTSIRENSEEMYSLDNDSFLNSLEAMTIQNYWTESVKHTKL